MKKSVSMMLTGGGARGAYQAGVLWRMAESIGVQGDNWKIDNVCGISAGAINAAFFASRYNDPDNMKILADLWSSLRAKKVYKTDLISLSRIGSSFVFDTALGPIFRKKFATSLVDTKPLRKLLHQYLDTNRIRDNITPEGLRALSVSAYDFNTDSSIAFLQTCEPNRHWTKPNRRSELTDINVDLIMASSAIPIIFPPVKYDGRYFADGVLRNTAPLSPLIHAGTDKMFIVGVQREKRPDEYIYPEGKQPSVGTSLGMVLNALFFDNFDMDIERLEHVNSSVEGNLNAPYKKIPYFFLRPSRSLTEIAKDTYKSMPRQIRYLLAGLGDSRESLEISSYLLFESEYTSRLVELGYQDFKMRQNDFLNFLNEN